ncbi:Glyoxylate reductase [Morus notabilis]|uniref:Glyoxylate reductase n=1 Tax=Morus notabilis TaxID=981085 RepID=W9RDX0_9ROSA|nr:Glyoxylate reductase [Morus notabilis]
MEREGVPPPSSLPTTATTILGKYRLGRFLGLGSFAKNANSIQAVVGNTNIGANVVLIGSLLRLRIVASYSVGLDKINLRKCEERGIRVTNSPDALTDDVVNKAIRLILAAIEILLQWLVVKMWFLICRQPNANWKFQ